jgi:hypothetical protein
MTDIEKKITFTALGWLGQEENRGNMGFKDEQFNELMKSVGHKEGQAWCAYFSKLVWLTAHIQEPKEVRKLLNAIMNGGAVASYQSFVNSDFLVDKTPREGAAVYWQKYKNGKASWMGHAGIVVEVIPNGFRSVEGNTNPQGGREGYTVAKMSRRLHFQTQNGLRVLGFVHPEMKDQNNTI